ncbi:MAG: hypothetical protein ACRD3W_08085 [Terriglobales bacterium]
MASTQVSTCSGFERLLTTRQEWHKEPQTAADDCQVTLNYVLPGDASRAMRICKNVLGSANYTYSELSDHELICINRCRGSNKPLRISITTKFWPVSNSTTIAISTSSSHIGSLRAGLFKQHLERILSMVRKATIITS